MKDNNAFGIPMDYSVIIAADLTAKEVRQDVTRKFEHRWLNPRIVFDPPEKMSKYMSDEAIAVYGDEILYIKNTNIYKEYMKLTETESPADKTGYNNSYIEDPEELIALFISAIPSSKNYFLRRMDKTFDSLKKEKNIATCEVLSDIKDSYTGALTMLDVSLFWNGILKRNDKFLEFTVQELANSLGFDPYKTAGIWSDNEDNFSELALSYRDKLPKGEVISWGIAATYQEPKSHNGGYQKPTKYTHMDRGTVEDLYTKVCTLSQSTPLSEVIFMYEHGYRNITEICKFFNKGLTVKDHGGYVVNGITDVDFINRCYDAGIDPTLAGKM